LIKVVSLHIYPIKGMQGVSVQSSKALERGFEHDRRYMLVDKDGKFISQRTHPQLVFFHPQIIDNQLVAEYKDQSISISQDASLQNTVETTIFENLVEATEVSHEANSWFTSILNEEVRLVKMGRDNIRYKELVKGPKQVEVSFADGYPYLITGTESLRQLNGKLDMSIDMNRFRPNIVVETSKAHIEDNWEGVKIGETKFMVIKPCARCPVPTIDQTNGTKSKEPIKTLASYRKEKNKVYFGANAISRQVGLVHIGDEVVVL